MPVNPAAPPPLDPQSRIVEKLAELERKQKLIEHYMPWLNVGGGIAGGPTGPAGGVLGGNYPNPDFAVDMATQAELNTHAALTTTAHGGIVASTDSRLTDARTPTSHTHPTSDITDGWHHVILSGDVPTSSTTFVDVTGLSFAVTNGVRYLFRALLAFDVDATTTGHQFSLNGPTLGVSARFGYTKRSPLTSTTEDLRSALSYDAGAATATTRGATGNICTIDGAITPDATGTLIVRFLSEVVSPGTVTVKRGALLSYMVV